MLTNDNIGFSPNNKKYQNDTVCSYEYKLMCADE